ncbi:ABC transporter ATP-binding protein [Paraburkholderia sp. JPY419]|uniref:ABC transporter ATP-binding protein n=1 Tax=Paraburkholderia sp. JPY419 TaxID=667660 RepID=UPI003D258170
MSAAPILRIRGLRTQFPTDRSLVRAVDGVDLDVHRGECLGVVGESGSGKTVTFLSALGLIAPPGVVKADSIEWEGRDIAHLSAAAMRALRGREIALTMQDALTALNPALTIGTQINEVLVAHGAVHSAAARRQRAQELLHLVGIPEPASRLRAYPHQLSGGMRQRAMIAVALACAPRLLIADEPTTALDVTVQAQVLELLSELRMKLNMSVVLITHNLAVVAEHCDRVAVMYAGQVVETGPAARVIAEPRHPYTAGLLASLPALEHPELPLTPMPGRAPDPARWPEGCRFAERCPLREAACSAPQPLRAVGDGEARCWKAREDAPTVEDAKLRENGA